MRSSRLIRWTLVAGLAACSSKPSPPGSAEQGSYAAGSTGAGGTAASVTSSTGGPTVGSGASGMATSSGATGGSITGSAASTATGTTTTTGGGTSGGGAGGSGSGQGGSAADRDASGAMDASSGDASGTIGVNDAGRGSAGCTNDRLALGSSRLFAGGATPTAFASAYNSELAVLTTAGPLLVALSGMSSTSGAQRADLGALGESPQGGATFAEGHASVPFSIDASRSIRIAVTEARFELKFVAPASSVLLPIVAVSLDSALGAGCGALAVTKMKLLVPVAAGSIDFHGSTVAGLMGVASEGYGGEAANAWPLELSGSAQQVFAPGAGTNDGGTPP